MHYQGSLLRGNYPAGERVMGVNNLTTGEYYSLVSDSAGGLFGLETHQAIDAVEDDANITGYVAFADREYSAGVYSVVQGADGMGPAVFTFTVTPVSVPTTLAVSSTSPQQQSYHCQNGPWHAVRPTGPMYSRNVTGDGHGGVILGNAGITYTLQIGTQDESCYVWVSDTFKTAVYMGSVLKGAYKEGGGLEFISQLALKSWQNPRNDYNYRGQIIVREGGVYLHDNKYVSAQATNPYYLTPHEKHSGYLLSPNDQRLVDDLSNMICIYYNADACIDAGAAFNGMWHEANQARLDSQYPDAYWHADPYLGYGPYPDGETCGMACYNYQKVTVDKNKMNNFFVHADDWASSDYRDGYLNANMGLPWGADYTVQVHDSRGWYESSDSAQGSGHFSIGAFGFRPPLRSVSPAA